MIKNSILQTIAYSDIFDYPLTPEEVRKRLIGFKASEKDTLEALSLLVDDGVIEKTADTYHLEKRAETYGLRKEKGVYSSQKIKKAQRIARTLKFIPHVRFIGLTGSLASNNSPYNDDIDFLIVTTTKRLWITRFFVVLVLKLLRSYRSEKNPNDKICPNIFLDESNLSWGKRGRNIYTAMEIMLIKPLLDKDGTYYKFMFENSWFLKFLPNNQTYFYEKGKRKRRSRIGDLLEKFLMRFQLWYMRKRRTSEVVEDNFAHFSRKDNKIWVLAEFEKRLKRLNLDIDVLSTI